MSQQPNQVLIEQLCYTWSRSGFDHGAGWQVRAASPGLRDMKSRRVQELVKFVRYNLPQGLLATPSAEEAPVCLSLTEAEIELASGKEKRKERERIMLQKVYKESDGMGRPNAFFSHLVAGLPNGFLAREAIGLWGSQFWRQSEENLPLELPYVEGFNPGILTEQTLAGQGLAPWLMYLLQAFLEAREKGQLYIAAPSDLVAALIWGLTRSLPGTLGDMQWLTFSTYEQNVNNLPERIIGTWLPKDLLDTPKDLPEFCYSGDNVGINLETGRCYPPLSKQTDAAEYARIATTWLLSERPEQRQRLRELLEDAERRRPLIRYIDEFLAFAKPRILEQSPTITEATYQLVNQERNDRVLKQQETQDTLVARIIGDSLWWNSQGREALRQFSARTRNDQDAIVVLALLVENLCKQGAELAQHENGRSFENLGEALALLVPPMQQVASYIPPGVATLLDDVNNVTTVLSEVIRAKQHGGSRLIQLLTTLAPLTNSKPAWELIFNRLTEELRQAKVVFVQDMYSQTTYTALLLIWRQVVNEENDAIRLWLRISWEALRDFMSLQLPPLWYQIAMSYLLEIRAPLPLNASRLIEDYWPLFDGCLQRYAAAGTPQQIDVALDFVANLQTMRDELQRKGLLAEAQRLQMLCLQAGRSVLTSSPVSSKVGERLGEAVQLGKDDITGMVEGYVQQYRPEDWSANFANPMQLYVNQLTWKDLQRPPTIAVLQYLSHPTFKSFLPDARNKAKCWLTIYDAPRLSTIDVPTAERLVLAIKYLGLNPDKEFASSITSALASYDYSDHLFALGRITYILGPVLAPSVPGLVAHMAALVGERYGKDQAYYIVYIYIRLVIEEALDLTSPPREQFLQSTLDNLLTYVQPDGADFKLLNEEIALWSPTLIQLWKDYLDHSRFKQSTSDTPPGGMRGFGVAAEHFLQSLWTRVHPRSATAPATPPQAPQETGPTNGSDPNAYMTSPGNEQRRKYLSEKAAVAHLASTSSSVSQAKPEIPWWLKWLEWIKPMP